MRLLGTQSVLNVSNTKQIKPRKMHNWSNMSCSSAINCSTVQLSIDAFFNKDILIELCENIQKLMYFWKN